MTLNSLYKIKLNVCNDTNAHRAMISFPQNLCQLHPQP